MRGGALRTWSVALCCCAPLPGAAQSSPLTVTGRVVHRPEAASPRPLPRHWVVLQAAGQDTGVHVDSTRTDAAGRFRLTLPRPDTTAVLVASTVYQGVEYFTEARRVEPRPHHDAGTLVVYDTSSGGPPLRLERRLVVVTRAEPRGGLIVQEMIEVSNPDSRTRIPAGGTSPVWRLTLPGGATAWAPREGDVAPEAFQVSGDTLRVFAPIWPGWPLRTSYEYALAGRAARVPIDQWTGELNLLVQDTAAHISGLRLDALGVHDLRGGRFAAYRAGPLDAGAELQVTLSRGAFRAEQLLPYLVGAVAVALAWGLWVGLKRRSPARAGVAVRDRGPTGPGGAPGGS